MTGRSTDAATLEHALEWLQLPESDQHVDFLVWHGLAGWWLAQLTIAGLASQIPESAYEKMTTDRRTASVMYLMQTHAISEVSAAFEKQHIFCAFFKGAAVREEAYAIPSLRSACDVDVLVAPSVRFEAIACLENLGFVQQSELDASAHEVTLIRGRVDIDLHWDILRAGRTRRPLVDSLLAERVRGPTLWRLSDTDTVFMMLAHPAITKYVCSRNMGLNRVLDLLLFTRTRSIDWAGVQRRLDEAGLQTAAWCTLRWISLLHAPDVLIPPDFLNAIAPGSIRKAYLNLWLIYDLPGRLLNRADWLIRAAFTLPLHDRPSDAWRAMRARASSRKSTRPAASASAP